MYIWYSYRDDKEKAWKAYSFSLLKAWAVSNNVKKQREAYPIVPYSSIFIFFLYLVLNYSPKAAK